MAQLSILAGATSQSTLVFVQDGSSTTGAGLAGLAYNTAGLTAYYSFAGANATAVAITLATLATPTAAWSSGGFVQIDGTNMPGWYRLDVPNAALAASKGRVVGLHLKGAANMAPCPVLIELTGWDNQDAVHGGLSAVPAAVPGAAGGLFIAGTNAATTITTGLTATFTGNLTGSVGSVTAAVTLPTIPANWITAAGINAAALNGKGDWLLASSYAAAPTAAAIDAQLSGTHGAGAWGGAAGGINLAQVLGAPRALDAVADGSITVGDAFWSAVCAAAGKESVTGHTYVVRTPATGTAIRTFILDDGTFPSTRD